MKTRSAVPLIGCIVLLNVFAPRVASQAVPRPYLTLPGWARQSVKYDYETGVGLPNPYREIPDWAKLPPGRMWGHVFGVGIDSHGNVWVMDRCAAASCVDSNVAPIQEFDSSGNYIKSIGAGLFEFPHGLYVDKNDDVWVSDAGVRNGKGNQVLKLSPDGKVLMRLGEAGVFAGSATNFCGPAAVTVGSNGDIFVTDGHAAVTGGGGEFLLGQKRQCGGFYMRIVKFSKDGTFIKAWGKYGSGPGDFYTPHGIAIDSTGRVFVADRGNSRIEIFNQDGKFLGQWKQFGKPCDVFIDANDNIYVADSDSSKNLWQWTYSVDNPCASCLMRTIRPADVGVTNPDFVQGIRIGSTKDGIVRAFTPPHMGPYGPTTLTERLAVDAKGTVYLADSRTQDLRVYVKASK
jgi:hypothetical protein